MKKVAVGVLALAGLCALLVGCKNPNDISNMSRADQEKAFQGDPVRGQQIGRQMRERYLGKGARPAAPQNAQHPATPTGQ